MTTQNNFKIISHPVTIDMMVGATWELAHKVLWKNESFGENEIAVAKSYIWEYFAHIPPNKFQKQSHKLFNNFRERISAAHSNAWCKNIHPCVWFNKSNAKGFSKTTETHKKEIRIRENFKIELEKYYRAKDKGEDIPFPYPTNKTGLFD